MDTQWFATEIDRLTNMYEPEIMRAQLNLFDSHDMPRFLTCVSEDLASLQLAMLFMFTYPGAPCIYYGDEIGLTGGHDPDCRKGFPWDDASWNHKLLDYTKAVIALRKEHPTLRRGVFLRLYAEDRLFAFARKLENRSFVIVLNVGEETKKASFSIEALGKITNAPTTIFGPNSNPVVENNILSLDIPPRKGTVIRL
jgi:glycosidase